MTENDWRRPHHVFRWFTLGLLILIVAWFAVSVFFYATRPVQGFYSPFYFPFFPFGPLFGFFMIFIIFGALRWLLWPWRGGYGRKYWRHQDEAYYILRERYARGELTRDQYEQMRQDLNKPSP